MLPSRKPELDGAIGYQVHSRQYNYKGESGRDIHGSPRGGELLKVTGATE